MKGDRGQTEKGTARRSAGGGHEGVLEECDRTLAADPNQIGVLHKKVEALVALRRIDDALDCLNRIIEIAPGEAAALVRKGDLVAGMGSYDDAIRCYDGALSIESGNVNALRGKALVLQVSDRNIDAVACYDRILALEPGDIHALTRKGDALLDLERYAEARESYDAAQKISHEGFGASDWTTRGDRLRISGKLAEAVVLYDRAIAADDRYALALSGKALALSENPDDEEEVGRCFSRALEIEPENALIWSDKGGFLFNKQTDYEGALGCFQKASEIDASDYYSWYNQCLALEMLDRYEEANTSIDRAIAIDGDNPDGWLEKAFCVGELGNPEESIRLYDRGIELSHGETLWALNGKGWAMSKLQRYAEAIQLFDEAIALDPAEITPWANKANCLEALGKYEEARRCLEDARKVARDQVVALQALGLLFSEYLYDHNTALQLYGEALKLRPKDIDSKASMAECLIKVGRYEEGRSLIAELKTRLKQTEPKASVLQCLTVVSYCLEGDRVNRAREVEAFLIQRSVQTMGGSSLGPWSDWNFRGLVDTIAQSNADAEARFLALTAIDLHGEKIDPKAMTFFARMPSKA